MGLANASQQFQQMMDDRLEPVRDVADPFIDDIFIETKQVPGEDILETHYRDVRRVLELLRKEQFICDQRKCKFFVKEVEFCGHILGNGQRKPAPGKLRAIEKWELPMTISALRAFWGLRTTIVRISMGMQKSLHQCRKNSKCPGIREKKGAK